MGQRVGRREACPSCGADLHCCKGCRFYDPAAYNECHEPVAERVVEKEKANFCDYFEFADRQTEVVQDEKGAKQKLEELFKK